MRLYIYFYMCIYIHICICVYICIYIKTLPLPILQNASSPPPPSPPSFFPLPTQRHYLNAERGRCCRKRNSQKSAVYAIYTVNWVASRLLRKFYLSRGRIREEIFCRTCPIDQPCYLTWLIHLWHDFWLSLIWRDSWLIHMSHDTFMTRDSFIHAPQRHSATPAQSIKCYLTWLIHEWHDSWLSHIWHDPWLSHIWRDSRLSWSWRFKNTWFFTSSDVSSPSCLSA